MNAADLVKQWEGKRLQAYPDPATHGAPWTVGYGFTGKINGVPIGPDTTLTDAECEAELEKRLAHTQHVVEAMLDYPAAPNQLAAMVSLAWNIGLGAPPDRGFEHSRVRHAWNQKDPKGAADAFLAYVHAAGRVIPGLVNRRYAERRVFLGDQP